MKRILCFLRYVGRPVDSNHKAIGARMGIKTSWGLAGILTAPNPCEGWLEECKKAVNDPDYYETL